MFLTNVCTVVYANSTLLLMSFMLDPKLLGLYGLADKILQWTKSGLVLIHNAVYPTLCRLVIEEPKQVIQFLKKTYRLVWLLTLAGAIVFYLNADSILAFFIDDLTNIPAYFKFLGFIIFTVSLNMPFFQSLLAWKIERPVLWIVFVSSIISITMNLFLVKRFGIPASLWILFAIEACIALSYFILFRLMKPSLKTPNKASATLA
jgi:O-antigen/teichoic acid export membrane protein